MAQSEFWIIMATATLAALVVVSFTGLSGWRGWLALQRDQLQAGPERQPPGHHPGATARIELADLKERIRNLEAIAAGVDP